MSKWFGIVFLVIGIGIYRSLYDPSLLGSAIVGAVSAGIGGALGELYDRKFGKYDYNIMYFIDNILWIFVFCVPGFILGSIVDSLLSYLINGNWNDDSTGLTTVMIVMIIVSLFLTYKKMRSKQRKRFEKSQEESMKL